MKKLYYILIITVVLLSCEKPISNFQSENFIKMFGSGNKSKGNDVIELSGGGYLITGYDVVNDAINTNVQMIYVAKVDKSGNLIWEKTYGNVNNVNEGKVVKEVSDGFVIAGTSTNAGVTYPIILKLDFAGNEVYMRELDDNKFSVTLMDIIVTDNNIFLAGFSDSTKTGHSDYYFSKLDLNANLIIGVPYILASNSSFRKIFSKNSQLLFLGTDGIENNVKIVETNTDLGILNSIPVGSEEELVDAAISYLGLITLSTSTSVKTKLTLLNESNSEDWSYENSDLSAKTVTPRYDGTVMICAENELDGISYIHFLKVGNGTLNNGDDSFKTFPGTISKMIETDDKGLILIGSTNETYGMNIQLIKTDKDFFMLKK